MTRAIQWVEIQDEPEVEDPDVAQICEGYYAFVAGALIGSVFTLDGSAWYGDFFGERIGSCRDREQAKGNIESRWALVEDGKPGGFI